MGLKATLCNLRTIVHNCALLWPCWADLLFLADLAFLENSKENPPKRQGFLLLAEPLKSLGKKGENAQNRKEFNSLKKKRQGKPKRQGKED